MPAKKNGQTGEEQSPPVEVKPDPFQALQAERRALESELAAIDGQIRGAISAGNTKEMTRLSLRKAELPRLFIEASMAETAARQAIFEAKEAENMERFHAAEDVRDKVVSEIAAKTEAFNAEMAALTKKLDEAEAALSASLATLAGARNLTVNANVAFQKSLAGLAGV